MPRARVAPHRRCRRGQHGIQGRELLVLLLRRPQSPQDRGVPERGGERRVALRCARRRNRVWVRHRVLPCCCSRGQTVAQAELLATLQAGHAAGRHARHGLGAPRHCRTARCTRRPPATGERPRVSAIVRLAAPAVTSSKRFRSSGFVQRRGIPDVVCSFGGVARSRRLSVAGRRWVAWPVIALWHRLGSWLGRPAARSKHRATRGRILVSGHSSPFGQQRPRSLTCGCTRRPPDDGVGGRG